MATKKKVLFLSFIPSPYRMLFFEELAKTYDLTVLFERESSKNRKGNWNDYHFNGYTGKILAGVTVGGFDRFCPSVCKYLTKKYDAIIISDPTSPTGIFAAMILRIKRIPYMVESDGAFPSQSTSGIKMFLKRFVMKPAAICFSTAKLHDEYYMQCGVKPENIRRYPFTSVKQADIDAAFRYSEREKAYYRQKCEMKEEKILLTVGRFSYENGYGKGYDVIMRLAGRMPKVGFYIVGDEPTQEFIDWREKEHLENVHFVGFKPKEALAEYYAAADLFALFTRGDVWGLVINEAMAYSLPIVTTTLCIAGTELVQDGQNGYLFENLEDTDAIQERVSEILENESLAAAMGQKSYEIIRKYSIESMSDAHETTLREIFGGGVRYNARLSAKRKLGITEDRMVLAVGQFVHRKGFDVLLQAAAKLPDTIGFYFVGDTAPQEYLQMVEQYRLKNIHFVGFTRKESLKDYYKACDLFVLPTREDIWGLVINEAMTYGLPILSTDRCIAALELVSEGENGWIVPTDDSDALANCIEKWQAMSQADRDLLGWESQKKISSYTIETMAQAHTKWLEEYWSKI